MNTVAQGMIGAVCGVLLVTVPAWGGAVQRRWEEWRLHRHHCPVSCRESIKCRCGCGGLHSMGERQERCGLCGAAITHDDEGEYDGPYSMGPGCMNEAGAPDEDLDRDDDRDWGPYR